MTLSNAILHLIPVYSYLNKSNYYLCNFETVVAVLGT